MSTSTTRISVVARPEPAVMALRAITIAEMAPSTLNLIPSEKYFGIDDLITLMLESKKVVHKYSIEEYWLDIGRVESYKQAQEDYREKMVESN